jgi:uncharacterized protein YndB with AHSA1/START domain
MEYASIEREIHIDAPPEVVFEVVSRPEHIRDWWGAETQLRALPGAESELAWADGDDPRAHVERVTVLAAEPPRVLSFRWTHAAGEHATQANSLLVTFELVPSGDGTLLRLTETGFRERGWAAAVLEEQYLEHATGWDAFVPRIADCAARLVSAS